jgi:hypothetical protein
MRGRLAFLVGGAAVAGAAVYRFLRPGKAGVAEPPADASPAAELRDKLVESREVVAEREEFESAETPVDRAEEVVPAEPADRRQAVHARGRKVAEQMRRGPSSEG